MPTLPAGGYPYQQFPSEVPSTQVPSAYQNIQATPGAFGASTAGALEKLGGAFEKAGDTLAQVAIQRQDLFNKVAADDQVNQVEDKINRLMYGDPDSPGDTGFMGKQGRDAMDAFPKVRASIDQIIQDSRRTLQNPRQALQFDEATRRSRLFTFDRMGGHYDSQFNKYAADAATARVALKERELSQETNDGNFAGFQQKLGEIYTTIEDSMGRLGVPPEKIAEAKAAATQKAAVNWTNALAIKNPGAAAKFAEANREHLGDQFDNVMGRVRARAAEVQAIEDVTGVKQGGAPNLIRGGAVGARVAQEAEAQNVDPTLAVTTAQIESGMGSNLGSRGNIFQLGRNEWSTIGGGRMGDTNTDIRNGVAWLAKTNKELSLALGRAPTPWETYLAHQQGVGGATSLLNNPNTPAGQLVPPENIRANGGDPSAPASQFVQRLRGIYQRTAANVGSSPSAEASTTYPTIAAARAAHPNQEIHKAPGGGYINEDAFPYPIAEDQAPSVGGSPDQLVGRPIPPPDQGQLADSSIPGLQQKIDEIAKRVPQDDPVRFLAAVKLARQQFNAAYADQQHAARAQQQQQKAADETISNQFISRMTTDSPNYPTTNEVMSNPQLSAEAKRTLVGFIERQTKPDPLSAVSARNQQALFDRIHAPDERADKVRTEKTINDSYINGDLTWDAKKELIADFRETQDASTKEIATQRHDLLKVLQPKLAPNAARMTHEDAVRLDPTLPERELAWTNAVKKRERDYRDAGKNPADLYIPGKPEYVGGPEFLAQPGIAPPVAKKYGLGMPLNTLSDIKSALAAGQITREQGIKRLVELGIGAPDTPVPNPAQQPPVR